MPVYVDFGVCVHTCTHFFFSSFKGLKTKAHTPCNHKKRICCPQEGRYLSSPFSILERRVMSLTDWFLNRWGRTFPFLSLFYSEGTCWGSWCLPANQPPAQDPGHIQRVSQGRTFWLFLPCLPCLLDSPQEKTRHLPHQWVQRQKQDSWRVSGILLNLNNLQRKWFLLLFIYVMWFQAAKDTCRDVSATCFFYTWLGMFILQKITQNSLWSPYLICIIQSYFSPKHSWPCFHSILTDVTSQWVLHKSGGVTGV